MSGWQNGEHILAVYDCEQGFLLMFGEIFNLWKTLLEYRGQNFFEDTFRNRIHVELVEHVANHRELKYFANNFLPFAKLTTRSVVTDIPTVPSVLPIKLTNHIDLRVFKNINQSDMKVRFESKVTRGFSPLRGSLTALSCGENLRKTSGTRVVV